MEANEPLTTNNLPAPPRVAVIIPTFNRWPHVCAAVDSVLAQTYPNIECIVVDDASTDNTCDLLRDKYGDRIRLLKRTRNGEKSAARDDGIRATQAAFVCLLDSDDLLTPQSVEARARLFLDDPRFNGVAYGPVLAECQADDAHRPSGARPEGDVLDAYIRHPFVHNNGYLISVANMRRYGMYREDLTHREDVELMIRLSARLEFRCCHVPVARLRRVDHSGRYEYSKYLRQGDRLLHYVRNDAFLVERLGKQRMETVEFNEIRALARACYRAGDFQSFRRRYLTLWRRWPSRTLLEGRFLRRFFASFFLQTVGRGGEAPDRDPIITRPFIADLLEGRRAAEVRRKPGRVIVRTMLTTDDAGRQRSVYLKIYSGKRQSAAVERQNLEWAAARGIPVPRLITAASFSGSGLAFRSALATEELCGMKPLHALIPRAAKDLSPAAFRNWKLGLGKEIARLTGLLHEAGRYHKDLYLCHFFFPEADLAEGSLVAGRLHLLDFLRLKRYRWNRRRWQVKDLAQLLYSSDLPGIGPRDRLHFMHTYLGCRKLDRHGRRLVKSVAKKAERYRRQNRGR